MGFDEVMGVCQAEVWHSAASQGHSGMCGIDWELGRHRGQAETAVKRILQHPGGRLGGLTNGVAVRVKRRGSERNLRVKEDDRAW